MNIISKKKDIESIFNNATYFLPIWQRRYEWDKPNWKNLWKTIISVYSDGKNKYRDVFFGTMLFQEKDVGELDYKIIDGQQRLITISLILSAIRDLTEDKNLIVKINYLLLKDHNQFEQQKKNEKIIPHTLDKTSYHNIINRIGNSNSSDPITVCYTEFKNYINSSSLDFNHLYCAVINHLIVAKVYLGFNESGGETFYELNCGGKKLETIDLIRVVFFADLDQSIEDIYYKNYWSSIEKDSYEYPDYFEEYISVIIKLQRISKEETPLESFAHFLRDMEYHEKEKLIKKILEDMNSLWKYYLWIKEPETITYNQIDDIKLRLIRLNILRINDVIPLFLNWFRLCDIINNTNPEGMKYFIELIDFIESFIVKNKVCKNTQIISEKLLKLNYQISPNCDLFNYLSEIKEFLRSSIPTDNTFYEELKISNIYNNSDLCKTILFALEYAINKNKSGIIWKPSYYWIEHIMPKSLNKDWIDTLGPNYELIHNEWCHTIGNLTLVPESYNREYSDKSFEKKKESYEEYDYGLFKSIKGNKEWTLNEINKRGDELIEKAKEIWKCSETDGGDIWKPPLSGDILKGIYCNGNFHKACTGDFFSQWVYFIYCENNLIFEKLKHNKDFFSINEKPGYKIYFKQGDIYLKSTKFAKNIGENCKKLRELTILDKDKLYGIFERKENGLIKTYKF